MGHLSASPRLPARKRRHLSSGTAIEILPDGTILLHGENAITMSAPTRIKMTCGASSLEMTPGNIKAQSPRIDFN